MGEAGREGRLWRAVLGRDASFDGDFVYAVRTTGIYCRPSCPSRRPERARVVFFPRPDAAEKEGYRACLRCRPSGRGDGGPESTLTGVERVREVCRYIEDHPDTPPTLTALARHVGASPWHLQRSFKQITGVTPRQYADERRRARLKEQLKKGGSVTQAMYEAGYGSSSRLYEKADAGLGMTPKAYLRGGTGAAIRYTTTRSPMGLILVAATDKGICRIMRGTGETAMAAELKREFPSAQVRRDAVGLKAWAKVVAGIADGRKPHIDLPLDIRATAFQRRVWEALQSIPRGATRSYGEVARAIGKPKAARAVGAACGANPVALVIPCHRVVAGDGGLGGYGWGLERKKVLLDKERS